MIVSLVGCVCVLCSVGENIKLLIDRPDGVYCFRLHKDRVYYVRSVDLCNLLVLCQRPQFCPEKQISNVDAAHNLCLCTIWKMS